MAKTRGNITIENIKIGDIHYEFEYGFGIKCEVLTIPKKTGNEWKWKSKNLNTGEIIDYLITEGFEYYGPNLYDYESYIVNKWI